MKKIIIENFEYEIPLENKVIGVVSEGKETFDISLKEEGVNSLKNCCHTKQKPLQELSKIPNGEVSK